MTDDTILPPPADPADTGGRTTHLYILLDRSGSMGAIADDITGGFNQWLRTQQAEGDDAIVTFIQFDDGDPHEVLTEATPISEVAGLDAATFVPRGTTPLLDATGRLIARADQREQTRRNLGEAPESIVFVSITDGHENSSAEFSLDQVRRLISERERRGWTFAFLSAAIDVYDEAGSMGYAPHSVQAFAPDAAGAALAFDSLSHATTKIRKWNRDGTVSDDDGFFGEEKPAEDDRKRRGH
jgi:Mg-chelatase subunit ChlD